MLEAANNRAEYSPFLRGLLYSALVDTDEVYAWMVRGHHELDPGMFLLQVHPFLDRD